MEAAGGHREASGRRVPGGPRRNRVTPMGDIVAVPLRGAWLGNRGVLHCGTEVVRLHASALWITCRLAFKGWRLPLWQEHHFTVLFFHDEAVSLAAGHRPCALCRRSAYDAYREAWSAGTGEPVPKAADLDRRLHAERLVRRRRERRLHERRWRELPDGAFVRLDDGPALVRADAVVPWTTAGYAPPRPRPRSGTASVVTPPSSLAALHEGYVPQLDPGAG